MTAFRRTALETSLVVFMLVGCGAGEKADAPDGSAKTLVQINPEANKCPVFTNALVLPQVIEPMTEAVGIVIVTDPDGPRSGLQYSWSASSGSFSTADRSSTSYRCAEPGPQVLLVAARGQLGCRSELALDVICLDH